ncbi:hypothetical protein JOC54_000250 [Alkalihalobacillus xiaoxiensis]|uniref:Uncharacterized protein n=1 Tax=Shouchella xiaoxiensis TaxID=766895 RepID=A0ABS2SNC0_9BACI|nr:hypothetical protein [Shouchella xiaoxiensis]MBM7837019.1 hypothetical protein [Shouchella xiaoxiensis]
MSETFYKRLFLTIIVVIGLLQFFSLPSSLNYVLLAFALFCGMMHIRLRFDESR